MRLEDLRTSHVLTCYLCQLAQNNTRGLLWPIEPRLKPERMAVFQPVTFYPPKAYNPAENDEYSKGIFTIYCNIFSTDGPFKSSKKDRELCVTHYMVVWANWVLIADIELKEYNAWQAWLERSEGGGYLLHG